MAEEKPQPQASSGLAFAVGFFFSFRAVIVLFSVRVLGTDPRVGAEANLALNFLLLGLVGFASLGSGKRTFGSMVRLRSIQWVFVFLVFSGCSLAWSVTAALPTSVVYWCGMAADAAMVFLLLRAGTVTAVAHSLMKGFIWSTCCLALLVWIMPAQADLRLGDQDFFNTNQIGNLCAFSIFMAQYLMRRKDGKWGVATAFLAVTLLRSLSKTTLVAFLLSEGYLVIQDRSISRKTKIYLTAALVVFILAFWGLFEAYYGIYTNTYNQAETLTGRTGIWFVCLNEALDKPWIGHGFDSIWKVIPPFGDEQFEARHAENEVLQQFYAYGVAGIVILTGLYWSLYWQIRKLQRGQVRIVFLSLMLFIVIRGLAEAEPFDLTLPLWAIVLISVLLASGNEIGYDTAPLLPSAGVGQASPASSQRSVVLSAHNETDS